MRSWSRWLAPSTTCTPTTFATAQRPEMLGRSFRRHFCGQFLPADIEKPRTWNPRTFCFIPRSCTLGRFPTGLWACSWPDFKFRGPEQPWTLKWTNVFWCSRPTGHLNLATYATWGHPAKRRALRKISWSWSTLAWQLPISCSVATFEGSREGHPDTLKGVYNNLKWISKIYDISYHINRGT